MEWLLSFANSAKTSDRFIGKEHGEHVRLLAMGLLGEVGSIVSEIKKKIREGGGYSIQSEQLLEEFGDFLWYFVRLCDVIAPGIITKFGLENKAAGNTAYSDLNLLLNFAALAGDIARECANDNYQNTSISPFLIKIWELAQAVANRKNVELCLAASKNIQKTAGRWPQNKQYKDLPDENFPLEEQLPRKKIIFKFTEKKELGVGKVVKIKYDDKSYGDKLNDNIEIENGYRYHDIFHFAYAVYLGWSPIMRKHMGIKRKSNRSYDENQDGARAKFLEEGISAIIFSHAKEVNFFEGSKHVHYDLLKTVRQVVKGFEVEEIPIWQWEKAILEGYKVFRKLKENQGGRVLVKISSEERELKYLVNNA